MQPLAEPTVRSAVCSVTTAARLVGPLVVAEASASWLGRFEKSFADRCALFTAGASACHRESLRLSSNGPRLRRLTMEKLLAAIASAVLTAVIEMVAQRLTDRYLPAPA